MSDRHDRSKNRPRPIIAKFTYWKQKEKVLHAARELKPEGVQFYPDFAKRTLQRRVSQISKLLEERKKNVKSHILSWVSLLLRTSHLIFSLSLLTMRSSLT